MSEDPPFLITNTKKNTRRPLIYIFGGLRGGESLEKNEENLLEVGGESFS